ncbi:MAG: hypothetical protein L6V93_15180 [Clostridiales bacterium]|nr:MAG: hypothetical protein L6V93_15180 [Clostridiales bacterium]
MEYTVEISYANNNYSIIGNTVKTYSVRLIGRKRRWRRKLIGIVLHRFV